MKGKIFLLVFVVAIMSIGFVAASDVATFTKDKSSTLFQLCDSCTYINITSIELPSKQIVPINELMTKNYSTYSYTYTFSEIGDGHYNVCGDKGGGYECESIPYTVTGSGISDTIGFYIVIIILTFGLIILGYAIQDYWVIILGAFGLILFGLYILFYGISGMEDAVYTWGIGIIILMLGAYFGTRAALEQLEL